MIRELCDKRYNRDRDMTLLNREDALTLCTEEKQGKGFFLKERKLKVGLKTE